jgi:hypothetical protein
VIVLTLVAAPNAGVLCQAWCDPAEAAATGCHPEDAGPPATLSGIDDCGNMVLGTAVLVTDSVRRGLSSPDTPRAVLFTRYPDAVAARESHPADEPGCTWSLAPRPLVTALRI